VRTREGGRIVDEAAVIARVRAGEPEAYAELVRAHTGIALRAAAALGAGADAEDVVQQAFVKAYCALGRFRDGAAFKPWLLSIVANETRNTVRTAVRQRTLAGREAAFVEAEPLIPESADPAVATLETERRTALLAALEQLSEDHRLVVTYRYLLEMDESETAQALGWPRGTVKSRLNRALRNGRFPARLADGAHPHPAHSAHTYHPLPVVVATADGAWMTDVEGRRYLDLLAGYSALNFGHGNRRLIEAAKAQLERVTLTSRAFHHDRFAAFCARLAELCGMEMVLPMNTGAEAVETAVKTARKWGYRVKGVPDGMAKDRRGGQQLPRPYDDDHQLLHRSGGPGGLRAVHAGLRDRAVRGSDGDARRRSRREHGGRAAGAHPGRGGGAGAAGRLSGGVRELTRERNVLFIADEIQSGLGRTGRTFACEHEGVVPDMYVLGKALGGGVVPVSAVVSSARCWGVPAR
jgi:RNA polymerase sigma factor (sigma-70 family)